MQLRETLTDGSRQTGRVYAGIYNGSLDEFSHSDNVDLKDLRESIAPTNLENITSTL